MFQSFVCFTCTVECGSRHESAPKCRKVPRSRVLSAFPSCHHAVVFVGIVRLYIELTWQAILSPIFRHFYLRGTTTTKEGQFLFINSI